MSQELDAGYWTALVRQSLEAPDVTGCLERHGQDGARLKWTGDSARIVLREVGVILHVEKTGPRSRFVRGVEFVLSGLRAARPYAGGLPHDIRASDSLMTLGMKLQPAILMAASAPQTFEACFPEHRLQVTLDSDELLRSCAWLSTRTLGDGDGDGDPA